MYQTREQAEIVEGDSTETMVAKVDAIMHGQDIMVLALGEAWHIDMPMGELLAGNDRERIGTASRYVSQIVEMMRFARTRPEQFRHFVEENRQTYDMAELAQEFGKWGWLGTRHLGE